MSESFLCDHCRREMCRDCKLIAEEYQHLLQLRTHALSAAENERERAIREMEAAKRRADDYEQIMKLGQHALVLAYMNSRSSSELRAEVERAEESIEKEKRDG